MLWFDDDSRRDMNQKVARAAAYYHTKYGVVPDTCFVNPTAVADGRELQIAGVRIFPERTILPHHFWLGVQSDN